jgi:signal transduction histidine kinase
MMDLYRAGTGRLALDLAPVDLGAVAAAAAAAVEAVVRERGHRLTVRVAPDAGPIRGDPVRLGQVLVNLLTNAARYTDPGGEISLTAGREGPAVVVRVRDTGVGIPAHLLRRVLDGSAPADPSRGGLGIGLRLVRRLVELHGGTVGVTSGGPGAGSEFVVTLPIDR